MSGKRLLDAVALINASRAVARQHLNIRVKQLDVYSKTSTLAKALKGSEISKVNTTLSPNLQTQPFRDTTTRQEAQSANASSSAQHIPSSESVQESHNQQGNVEGLEQDHSYRREDNAVTDNVPEDELHIQQEKAKRHPLPDGTIPPAEEEVDSHNTSQEVFNKRPSTEPVKEPLGKDEPSTNTLEPESSNRSSIPDPKTETTGHHELSSDVAKILQRQSEFQIPSRPADPPAEEAYEVNGAPGEDGPELGVDQEQDTFYRASDTASPVLSALPRIKLPKNAGDIQGGDSHIKDDVNADVFYSSDATEKRAAISQNQAKSSESEPSEEMINQIFHSPRVARVLGSKGQFRDLKPKYGKASSRAQMSSERGIDGGQLKSTGTNEFRPASWAKKERDGIAKLAADIQKDTQAPQKVSQTTCVAPATC
jgi:aarF domain-containing kinase